MGSQAGNAASIGRLRSVQRSPARFSVRLTAAVLVALLPALAFGGCGDDGEECSHCCACECSGESCDGSTQYLERSSCLDCAEVCNNHCAATQCTAAGIRSCDNVPACTCICTCAECPTLENSADRMCRGDNCDNCMMTCRDACQQLQCSVVVEFRGCE